MLVLWQAVFFIFRLVKLVGTYVSTPMGRRCLGVGSLCLSKACCECCALRLTGRSRLSAQESRDYLLSILYSASHRAWTPAPAEAAAPPPSPLPALHEASTALWQPPPNLLLKAPLCHPSPAVKFISEPQRCDAARLPPPPNTLTRQHYFDKHFYYFYHSSTFS